jgi:hypothetical protein
MSKSIKDILAGEEGGSQDVRAAELRALKACMQVDGPIVTWLQGGVGCGRTALLEELAHDAVAAGCKVVRIDCRTVEPTETGLLASLGEILGQAIENLADAVRALKGERILIIFDSYQVFRLADTWLRQEFIPALDETCRVILAGREPPSAGWLGARVWHKHFAEIRLQLLTDLDDELIANSLLDEVSDPATRDALEAVAVVRRVTRPILDALSPGTPANELYEQLAGLSFVERRRDGLAIRDVVRDVIGERLLAADPERYRGYQKKAWALLKQQLRQSTRADLWRCTADVIYLLENPVIREAFFPSTSAQFSVEPATAADKAAIFAIAEAHEPTAAVQTLELWWQRLPAAFHAVRDAEGGLVGFYCVAKPQEVTSAWMQADPVARIWQADLAKKRDRQAPALFIRRWLGREDGESPGAVQGASWIDLKRTYLELRPELRRVYLTVQDLAPYGPAATQLGFKVLDEAAKLGDATYYSAALDFGPGSVDGWICDLLGAELGVADDQLLDPGTRELILGDEHIPLTPLEYGVVAMLESRPGEAISRGELLQNVWGQDYEGGSNVVDAVIRGLRKKCGEKAMIFETVRGVGYRLRV